MTKIKRPNNDLQNIIHKTNDQVTRTPLKTGSELRCSGRVRTSCPTNGNSRVTLVTNLVTCHEWGKDWKATLCVHINLIQIIFLK
jgi:hypothetical protein